MRESTKPFLTTAVALKLQLSAVRRSTLEGNGSCATRVRLGGGGNLQLDVNFMLRVPLRPVVLKTRECWVGSRTNKFH
jgi:hypothetical protein